MPLRILFADDSVTAQNMGRKILTEAGYEVVAVSNGAAAVKKIAEQKPDIIILDIYMPGYSGLEVCEKVRGSMETLKTPVLLTVGKLEHYKPEETSRVRADGVIVKPFEASDLLAIIKKFEQRLGQASALVQPVERFHENEPEEIPVEQPEPVIVSTQQATVEVPDHMATSSAFSDLLGSDSAHGLGGFGSVAPPPVPEPVPARTKIPEYDVPVSWRDQLDSKPEAFAASIPIPEEAAPARDETEPPPRPLQIPVYQEREAKPAPAELMPTAMPPAGDIDIPREPELQESAAEETRNTVADTREPGLVPTVLDEASPALPSERDAVATPAASAAPQITPPVARHLEVVAPVESVSSNEPPEAAAEGPEAEAESDFEARVAQAMAAYSNSAESVPKEEPVITAHAPETTKAAAEPAEAEEEGIFPASKNAISEAVERSEDRSEASAIAESTPPVPSPDYHASLTAHEPESLSEPVAIAPEPEPAPAVDHQAVAASLEAAIPQAAAAAAAAGTGAGADHHTIAQAVHKVMEKLKPELVEEILRELKSKE